MYALDNTTLPVLGRFKLYQQALACARLVLAIQVQGDLRDQLHRAMHSIVLNAAEGAGNRPGPAKSRYYGICRASVFEASAAIDLLRLRGVPARDLDEVASILRELDAILHALLRR